MAKETVQIVFSADTQQARALFQELAAGQDKFAKATEKSTTRTDGFAMSLGKAIGAASAGIAIWNRLSEALERHNQKLKEAGDLSRQYEIVITKILNQAGFGEADRARVSGAVGALALRQRVTTSQAGEATRQLTSTGFNIEEVLSQGGSGDEFFRMLQAMNATGRDVDPASLVRASGKMLFGNQMPYNAQSIRALSVPLYNLFKNTPIEIADLERLGPIASSLSARGIGMNEQLAVMSVLAQSGDPSVGATGFAGIVGRLASASENKEVQRGLGLLGLSAGQTDLVGESFTSALGLISERIADAPETRRAGALKLIAGQEHLKTLEALTRNMDIVRARQIGISDATIFEQSVRNTREAFAAQEVESATKNELANEPFGTAQRALDKFIQDRATRRAIRLPNTTTGQTLRAVTDWIEEVGLPRSLILRKILGAPEGNEIILRTQSGTRIRGDVKATDGLPQ